MKSENTVESFNVNPNIRVDLITSTLAAALIRFKYISEIPEDDDEINWDKLESSSV